MKTASEDLLRERIKEETARIIRQKFNEVAATVDLSTPTTPLPPPPNLTPLVEANERLLQEQRETREQQRRQFAEQRAQQQRPDTDEQAQAKQIQGKIKELLKPGQRLSKKEIYEWIEESVALARDDGRLLKKLEHTGLVKYDIRPSFDPDTGERTADRVRVYPGATKSSYFMNLRVKSFAAWGVTMAVSAGLVELGNTVSGGGVAVALGMASAVNGVNLVVQWYLEKKHNDTFKNTWVEIQNELGTMDPKRAPALAGIMFLLVDKYSPLMWHRDRTQFWLPGQPSSVTAVLDHLKEAAAAALNNVRGTSEGYYKGVDVKEKVALAKTGLENLTKRWAGHWLTSSWWSTTLTCGSLLGSLGLAVGTLS
jgi:hypothetical protein